MNTDGNDWRGLNPVTDRRSFVLMGVGALVGLLMAGYALFTARGTSTLIVPAEDVALVNQQPISRSDYLLQLQTLLGVDWQHATRDQRRKVLDGMIREELFVQRGKELDVASIDPDVRNAMVNSVELAIAADAITSQPTEAQLRAYYALHQDRYASEGIMTLYDWVFASTEERAATAAADSLASMSPTSALVMRWQASVSHKVIDEEFYFAAKIHLGDQLFEVARALADSRVSPAIKTKDAIHVLYMVTNKKPVPFAFPAARDQVLSDYRNASIAHLRVEDESFLRKRANILITDDVR